MISSLPIIDAKLLTESYRVSVSSPSESKFRLANKFRVRASQKSTSPMPSRVESWTRPISTIQSWRLDYKPKPRFQGYNYAFRDLGPKVPGPRLYSYTFRDPMGPRYQVPGPRLLSPGRHSCDLGLSILGPGSRIVATMLSGTLMPSWTWVPGPWLYCYIFRDCNLYGSHTIMVPHSIVAL